jgi:hypothetical protein
MAEAREDFLWKLERSSFCQKVPSLRLFARLKRVGVKLKTLGWLEAVALREGPWNFWFSELISIVQFRKINFSWLSRQGKLILMTVQIPVSYRADLTENTKMLLLRSSANTYDSHGWHCGPLFGCDSNPHSQTFLSKACTNFDLSLRVLYLLQSFSCCTQ